MVAVLIDDERLARIEKLLETIKVALDGHSARLDVQDQRLGVHDDMFKELRKSWEEVMSEFPRVAIQSKDVRVYG